MVLVIAGFGMLRLGITPGAEEIVRLIVWLLVTVLYVALWLAFGLLLSVVIRRAATSALVGFGDVAVRGDAVLRTVPRRRSPAAGFVAEHDGRDAST